MVIVHTMVIVHIYIYMNHVLSQPPVPRSDSEERGIQAEAHQDVNGPHRPAQCSCCQVGGICHGTPGLDRKKEVKDKALFGEHHWGNLCDGILDSVLNEVAMVIGFSLNGVYESAWWQIQFELILQIWMMTNSVWTEFTSLHDDNTWACNTHTMGFHRSQVNKYSAMARERLELSKALLRASDKAANPKAKAAPKAAASAANSKPRSEK